MKILILFTSLLVSVAGIKLNTKTTSAMNLQLKTKGWINWNNVDLGALADFG